MKGDVKRNISPWTRQPGFSRHPAPVSLGARKFITEVCMGMVVAAVVGAVGMWESRAVCGIPKRGGKLGVGVFQRASFPQP